MGNARRQLKAGDLVKISTPDFYSRALGEEIEGRSGVILEIKEVTTPFQSERPTRIYSVLIDGNIVSFYSDKYMRRV